MRVSRLAADEAVPILDHLSPPWPGRLVPIDGVRGHVRETPARSPDAEPALYLHGLGGSSSNWTDLAELLADRLDGQAIDLPGFGGSEPAGGYTVARMSRRVARWIEVTGRGPVHLFGNSFGGTVAVRLAATRPELVRTLTLISPAMPFLNPRRSVHGRLVPLAFLPRAARLAARRSAGTTPADLAQSVIDACFADPSRFPAQRLTEAVEEIRLQSGTPWFAEAYVRSLRALVSSFVRAYLPGAGSLWRLAGRITAPTLVIAGREDRLVDVLVPAHVARLVPDSRLLVLHGVGHVAHMEAPRLVARAVLALLDEAGGNASVAVGGLSGTRADVAS